MAKKKSLSQKDIINFYIDYVLEHDKNPKTVFIFAKINNFEEALFYEHYTSFEAMEKGVFESFFKNSINILHRIDYYINFSTRNKLLSFYYTFFEILKANRSYVKHVLDKYKGELKDSKELSGLNLLFTGYVSNLEIQMLEIKPDQLKIIQEMEINESGYLQLLLAIKFWLDDTSISFENTDIVIEKAVETTFDLTNIAPLEHVMDLSQFISKEKFYSN